MNILAIIEKSELSSTLVELRANGKKAPAADGNESARKRMQTRTVKCTRLDAKKPDLYVRTYRYEM